MTKENIGVSLSGQSLDLHVLIDKLKLNKGLVYQTFMLSYNK